MAKAATVEKFAVVVGLEGAFGFVGKYNDKAQTDTFVVLENAITLSVDKTGTPFCSFMHVPAGTLSATKTTELRVPVKNVAYILTFNKEDNHPLTDMYNEYIAYIEEQERGSELLN